MGLESVCLIALSIIGELNMQPNQNERIEKFLSIPEAALRLGIPTSTLRRAVKSGLVPSYQPLGQRIRVRTSEIIAVIEAHKFGGPSDE